MGVKYITSLETDMKFDIVVSNPPYTQGTKYLYRYFFEKSLELANKVCMVLPYRPNSNYDSLKKLNALIQKHAVYVSENVSKQFNVGLDNIHYVIVDRNIVNEVKNYVNPLLSYKEIYPSRKRLDPIKGNTAVSNNKKTAIEGINILDKVLASGPVYRMVESTIAESAPQKIQTKYSVFTNHTPSLGKFNVHIEENFKSTWSMSVFAYEVNSKDEAEKLKSWIESEEIINEINKMLALKDTYAVTLEMLRRLPWYE
jgi:hypothetical protein